MALLDTEKELEFNNPSEAQTGQELDFNKPEEAPKGVEKDFNISKKEEVKKFAPKDYGNVRVYPNTTGSNMDKNNKWIGKHYSLQEAHNLDDEYLRKNLVGKTKSGSDIYKMPDGYFAGNPRINAASFKSTKDLEDFEGKNAEHLRNNKEGSYLDEFIKNYEKPTYTPFKLDKNKYKDVEETPYGFIYNAGNQSITDLAEQERAFGNKIDPNKKYGFTRTTDSGDEIFHETFEDAYNAIKGGKEQPKESKIPQKQVEENIDPKQTSISQYLKEELNPSTYDDNIFETLDGKEYLVVDENEAYQYAKDDIESIFDDLGLESFTPNFQEWIIQNAIDENYLNQTAEEEADYYEQEGEPETAEYFRNMIGNPQKIINHLRDIYGKDINNIVKDYIDIEKVVDEAIKWDGIAHFVARYDGKEIDLGNGLFAYRTN